MVKKALAFALLIGSVAPSRTFAQDATIEATPRGTALAGSTVTVKWSGPNGPGDYITVARKGAGPADYLDYRQTNDGRTPVNPLSIVMPVEPGAYEIRYVRSKPRTVLVSVPYEVTAVVASVEGPASVTPDSRFQVTWSGPNNRGDWVTIAAAGSAPRAYGSYVDARDGRADTKTGASVATLRAPAAPGRYELRYVQQGTRVIGTRTIDVSAAAPPAVPSTGAASPTPPAAATGATGTSRPPASSMIATGLTPTSGGLTVDPSKRMKSCITAQPPQYSATPGGIAFTFNRPTATTGYRISRRDLGELTPAPITALSYTHAAPLEYQTTYEYVVTGEQSDGGCTTATVSVPAPKPLTPQVTTRVAVNGPTGVVTLSWGAQADRPTKYLVLGTRMPATGTEVAASTTAAGHSLDIGNLPGGTYSWLITPVWTTPAGNAIDVGLGAFVTATVATTTGPYRITLDGFVVNSGTNAGTFGGPNAVYAAAAVEVLNRQQNFAVMQSPPIVLSSVHGDVGRDSTRVKAGTALPTGGLAAGDVVPGRNPAQISGSGLRTTFPMTLWEGQLTNGVEAVVVRPTLWVVNGAKAAFDRWATLSKSKANRDFELDRIREKAGYADLSPFRWPLAMFRCYGDLIPQAGSIACAPGFNDRPIGLSLSGDTQPSNVWRDLVVVVTREAIEKAPNGVITIRLADESPNWAGNYDLYLRVERGATDREELFKTFEETTNSYKNSLKTVTNTGR